MENKSNYFIYHQIKKSHEPFTIWKNPQFWKRWMEINISETKNNFTNTDDYYFTILMELCNSINHLNFDINFVKKTIIDTIAVEYIKDVIHHLIQNNIL